MLTVVVAGTFIQFQDWCIANGVNPKRPHDAKVVYAGGAEVLRGIPAHSVRVVYTGTPKQDVPVEFFSLLDKIAAPAQ